MMTGAYFVGRKELLSWVNDLLSLQYKKVEELCTGAAYCQIFDAMFPGKVNLKRVNFKANQEYQYVENFKVLQTAFKTLGITKIVNVVVLTGGSYQENLEFIQWIKAYYDQHVPANAPKYDAVGRRAGKVSNTTTTTATNTTDTRQSITPTTPVAVSTAPTASIPQQSNRSNASSSKPVAAPAPQQQQQQQQQQVLRPTSSNTTTSRTGGGSKNAPAELQKKVAELQVLLDRAEQERDFYFDKLRDVEIYCQTHPDQNNQVVKDVTNILYAAEDESE